MAGLFRLISSIFGAERAHSLCVALLRFADRIPTAKWFLRKFYATEDKALEREVFGLRFRNPIGLAAGFDRNGEIFMVQSATEESFHDFSLALVDLGVDHAVYLVGSSALGLAVDENGERYEWGNNELYTRGRHRMPRNTSYIVWRRK